MFLVTESTPTCLQLEAVKGFECMLEQLISFCRVVAWPPLRRGEEDAKPR